MEGYVALASLATSCTRAVQSEWGMRLRTVRVISGGR